MTVFSRRLAELMRKELNGTKVLSVGEKQELCNLLERQSADVQTSRKTNTTNDVKINYLYERKYAQEVVVAKSGGEFTDIQAAIDSCTGASADKRFLVKVCPGTYIGKVKMRDWVDIRGAGRHSTRIQFTGDNNGTLVLADWVQVEDLLIETTKIASEWAIVGVNTSNWHIRNVDILSHDTTFISQGIKVSGATWSTGFIENCVFNFYCKSGYGIYLTGSAQWIDTTIRGVFCDTFGVDTSGYGGLYTNNVVDIQLRDCYFRTSADGYDVYADGNSTVAIYNSTMLYGVPSLKTSAGSTIYSHGNTVTSQSGTGAFTGTYFDPTTGHVTMSGSLAHEVINATGSTDSALWFQDDGTNKGSVWWDQSESSMVVQNLVAGESVVLNMNAGDIVFYDDATDTITLTAGAALLTSYIPLTVTQANATITIDALTSTDANLWFNDAGTPKGGLFWDQSEGSLVLHNDVSGEPIVATVNNGTFSVYDSNTSTTLLDVGATGNVVAKGTVATNLTGVLSIAAGKTLTCNNTISIDATDNCGLSFTIFNFWIVDDTGYYSLNFDDGGAILCAADGANVTFSGTGTTLALTTSLTNNGAAGTLTWGGAYTLTIPKTGTVAVGTGTATRIAEWVTDANTLQASTLIKSGAGVLTLSAGGAYTLTVPATGTAALLATANEFTTNQKVNANSTTALLVEQDGVKDNVGVFDTTNGRFGVNTTPSFPFHLYHATAGNPATTGSTDTAVAHRVHVSSIGVDIGVASSGNAWIQPRIYNDFTSNYGLNLLPNGGNLGVGDPSPGEKLDVTGNINCTGVYKVDDVQVVSNRVIDARIDDAINTSAWDSTTAGVLDALRDAAITHGWIAAA